MKKHVSFTGLMLVLPLSVSEMESSVDEKRSFAVHGDSQNKNGMTFDKEFDRSENETIGPDLFSELQYLIPKNRKDEFLSLRS